MDQNHLIVDASFDMQKVVQTVLFGDMRQRSPLFDAAAEPPARVRTATNLILVDTGADQLRQQPAPAMERHSH
jgi:hypothetical protein